MTTIAQLKSAKTEARRRFLGKQHVVGVGFAGSRPLRIVFLLECATPDVQQEIVRWAHQSSLPIQFEIVGALRAADGDTRSTRGGKDGLQLTGEHPVSDPQQEGGQLRGR